MANVKRHWVLVVLVSVLVAVVGCTMNNNRGNYSLADFGVQPLATADCSSLKNVKQNSTVNFSFNASDVSSLRDKVKVLIAKYNGHISFDSFESYPAPHDSKSSSYSQDTASIAVTFDKSQNEFLAELSSVVKSSGGINSNYNFSDVAQSQPYSSCVNTMQNVATNLLQLEVFTKALRGERNAFNVSILSQSISNTKGNLQNDVNSLNDFFPSSAGNGKPLVSISISTLQK